MRGVALCDNIITCYDCIITSMSQTFISHLDQYVNSQIQIVFTFVTNILRSPVKEPKPNFNWLLCLLRQERWRADEGVGSCVT